MAVDISDRTFATVFQKFISFGTAGACYRSVYHATCSHSGHFNINLENTTVRVKPTVSWKGWGWWDQQGFDFMVNFERSPNGREISANSGGWCGLCEPVGSLILELGSCVQKSKSSID